MLKLHTRQIDTTTMKRAKKKKKKKKKTKRRQNRIAALGRPVKSESHWPKGLGGDSI